MSSKRPHHSSPDDLTAAEKRRQRELKSLEPFGWDKRKDKHPPNVAKLGMIPRAVAPQPPSDPDHSGSDTEDVHDTDRDADVAAPGSHGASPAMRHIVQAVFPKPNPSKNQVRSAMGAAVEAMFTAGGGVEAKRPRDEAGGSGDSAALKKAKKEEKKKARGRKNEPKQLPPAPIAPTVGGNLYALLRTSSRPPSSQGLQTPAATPAQAAVEAAALAPAPAAPTAAAAEPPSLPALLALMQPLYDSLQCGGGLRGIYASCYTRMSKAQRAEHAEAVGYFTAAGDLEGLKGFLEGTVNPPAGGK